MSDQADEKREVETKQLSIAGLEYYPELITVRIEKEHALLLNWLKKAVGSEKMPICYKGIVIRDNLIEATNGFALHRVVFENESKIPFPSGFFRLKTVTQELAVLETIEEAQPIDADKFFPAGTSAEEWVSFNANLFGRVAGNLVLDPKYLKPSLSIFGKANIYFGSGALIIQEEKDWLGGIVCTALIMPMTNGKGQPVAENRGGISFISVGK